ncbi:MAG: GNAT family N-acetyltransferase [Clostridia bacterium]|nr:GNAT family N-acetyltransferase [Clostridia bacterium]
MIIRRAESGDLEGLKRLLYQVCQIHADGRPDLFRAGGIKYTDQELLDILPDDSRPVFVCAENDQVLGYAFCILEDTPGTTSLQPVRTLYLDDLCVEASARGRHIGTRLYERVLLAARELGCSRVTLHAWNFNEKAFGFYEKLGMTPLYTAMEQKL